MKQIVLLLVFLMAGVCARAQVKVSSTPGAPATSAMLELQSTSKGFLPPRMTSAERSAIASPVAGLMIFNTTRGCVEMYNGSSWGCLQFKESPMLGSQISGFSANTTCTTVVISAQHTGNSCNRSITTPQGNTYNVVLINGQCWMQTNLKDTPSNFTYNNTWLNNTNYSPDTARYGFYNTSTTNGSAGFSATEPAAGEGMLYQWNAAMNGSATERAQGACPSGWHVPSDCEFKYLEHSLGMSVADQNGTNWRSSGSVGSKLSTLASSGTNSTKWTGLMAGFRVHGTGSFVARTTDDIWWASTASGSSTAYRRGTNSAQVGTYRLAENRTYGFAVRCLKD